MKIEHALEYALRDIGDQFLDAVPSVPVVRLEALEDLVQKWREQTGAKESISFRFAMRRLEKLVDDWRAGKV